MPLLPALICHTCCNELPCVAVCTHTPPLLPLTGHTCCSVLQRYTNASLALLHISHVLQRVAVCTYMPVHIRHSCSLARVAVCCSVYTYATLVPSRMSHTLQCVAGLIHALLLLPLTCHTCCSVLQLVAACTYTPVLLFLALAHEPLLYCWWLFVCKCVRHLGTRRIFNIVRGSGSYV